MGYPVARDVLVKRALRKADVDASVLDIAGDGWLSTEEMNDLVVASATRFYDLTIDVLGPESMAKEHFQDFGPTIQPPPVFLPTDFYRLVSVHVCDQSATPSGLKPFEHFETIEPVPEHGEAMTALLNMQPADGPFFYQLRRVRIVENTLSYEQLEIWPYPVRDRFVRVMYVPCFDRRLDSIDEPVYDGINGWDEWIVLDVAIAIRAKEEGETAVFERERERVETRIREKYGKQDTAHPRTPIDVRGGRARAAWMRQWPR